MSKSLKLKLVALSCGLSFISVIVGVISFVGVTNVEKDSAIITEDIFPKVELVNSMALDFRETRIQVRTLGITGLSSTQGEEAIKNVVARIAHFDSSAKKLLSLPMNSTEKS